MYPGIPPRTASLHTIAWFSTICWLTLCVKLPKCDTTLFLQDDIKIYDASKSTAVFSRTQSCLYQYLWICKVSLLEDTLSLRNLLLSKMDSNFLTIFLNAPYRGIVSPKRKDTRWLIENHHGIQWEDEMVPYCMARSLITKAVMGDTTTTDDNDDDDDDDNDDIIVYIKEHEKRECGICWSETGCLWEYRGALRSIESLNKLNVIHTFRCQKHVKNCALQNVFNIYNWWHQRQIIKNKHILSKIWFYFLFFFPITRNLNNKKLFCYILAKNFRKVEKLFI